MDLNKNQIYLRDVWPTRDEIGQLVKAHVTPAMFTETYSHIYKGSLAWQGLQVTKSVNFDWDPKSTYIKKPPFFDGMVYTILYEIRGECLLARPQLLRDLRQFRALIASWIWATRSPRTTFARAVPFRRIRPRLSICRNAGQELLAYCGKCEKFQVFSAGSTRKASTPTRPDAATTKLWPEAPLPTSGMRICDVLGNVLKHSHFQAH